MVPQWIIEKKRDGGSLDDREIRDFIAGYTDGSIPDYQMSALAMAIYFKGMNFDEVTVLTDAMMRSGETLDMSPLGIPTADKHSTGGIGDKVSLILAPIVAACGVGVPMLSGRGLGITGGTLDKLESIPGYRTDLSTDRFMDVLREVGCSIIGQTAELAPADKKFYALRDVTATVPSIPLISASIMSKKLAEGAATLVLDVKWGRGAFMKEQQQAAELARTMVEIGRRMGRRMVAVLTDMNQPLGRTAGNALEVVESIEALQGRGPQDLMEVTELLSAWMIHLSGKAATVAEAAAMVRDALASGRAWDRFVQMVQAHGGDVAALSAAGLPRARLTIPVAAPRDGTITQVDADGIGRAVLILGAGRQQVTDPVDHAVGLGGLVKIGEQVRAGDPLCILHVNDETPLAEATTLVQQAIEVGTDARTPPALIGETILPEG